MLSCMSVWSMGKKYNSLYIPAIAYRDVDIVGEEYGDVMRIIYYSPSKSTISKSVITHNGLVNYQLISSNWPSDSSFCYGYSCFCKAPYSINVFERNVITHSSTLLWQGELAKYEGLDGSAFIKISERYYLFLISYEYSGNRQQQVYFYIYSRMLLLDRKLKTLADMPRFADAEIDIRDLSDLLFFTMNGTMFIALLTGRISPDEKREMYFDNAIPIQQYSAMLCFSIIDLIDLIESGNEIGERFLVAMKGREGIISIVDADQNGLVYIEEDFQAKTKSIMYYNPFRHESVKAYPLNPYADVKYANDTVWEFCRKEKNGDLYRCLSDSSMKMLIPYNTTLLYADQEKAIIRKHNYDLFKNQVNITMCVYSILNSEEIAKYEAFRFYIDRAKNNIIFY